MPKLLFKIGTRGSELALAQAGIVKQDLEKAFSDCLFELVTVRTKGDDNLAPFDQVGTKGIFTRAIDRQLIDGKVDFAVHSLKDLPSELPREVSLACVPPRMDPRDALVSNPSIDSLKALPQGATVGTSSPRRRAQVLAIRPDVQVVPVRGNLNTRIRMVRENANLDAIIVAMAGLKRSRREGPQVHPIPMEEVLPPPGQGALAVTVRSNDARALKMAKHLEDDQSRIQADAERGFLRALGASCEIPCAAYARVGEGRVDLRGALLSLDGQDQYDAEVSGPTANAEALGPQLRDKLFALGAEKVWAK
jgi:hydroxymethylbilane synthase